MAEVFVARAAEIADGGRRIVKHGPHSIGVFRWDNQFYAYSNICVHQGGPACEGVIMHKVEDIIGEDRTWQGQRFSPTEVHFVCPWHGYEFDMRTGECVPDRRLKLRRYKVVQRGEDVYVVTD